MAIKCGHCKDTHATVAEVRACSTAPKARHSYATVPANLQAAADDLYARGYGIGGQRLSTGRTEPVTIDQAVRSVNPPKAPARPVRRSEVAEGLLVHRLYEVDGKVYFTEESKGSGRLYAYEIDDHGKRHYAKGAIFRITPEDLMTLERAAELGKMTGTCYQCGRVLTNPKSVELGIGPICRGEFG